MEEDPAEVDLQARSRPGMRLALTVSRACTRTRARECEPSFPPARPSTLRPPSPSVHVRPASASPVQLHCSCRTRHCPSAASARSRPRPQVGPRCYPDVPKYLRTQLWCSLLDQAEAMSRRTAQAPDTLDDIFSIVCEGEYYESLLAGRAASNKGAAPRSARTLPLSAPPAAALPNWGDTPTPPHVRRHGARGGVRRRDGGGHPPRRARAAAPSAAHPRAHPPSALLPRARRSRARSRRTRSSRRTTASAACSSCCAPTPSTTPPSATARRLRRAPPLLL